MLTVNVWLGLTLGVVSVICGYQLALFAREWIRDMVRAEVQAELKRVGSTSSLFMVRPGPPSQRNVN